MTSLPALGERTIWIHGRRHRTPGQPHSITVAFAWRSRARDAIRTIPLHDYAAPISVGIVDGEIEQATSPSTMPTLIAAT